MPDKVTIPTLIEVIKNWKRYDEECIKDRVEVISSTSKEQRKIEAGKEKEIKRIAFEEIKLQLEAEERRLQAKKEDGR